MVRLAFLFFFAASLASCGVRYINSYGADCGKGYFAGPDNVCLHWPQGSVITYSFDPSVYAESDSENQLSSEEMIEEIQAAFDEWTDVVDGVTFQFDTTPRVQQYGDGHNTIKIFHSNWNQDELMEGHAVTVASGIYLVEGDISINAVNYFYSTDATPGRINIKSLSMHEIGHVLGLAHNHKHSSAIMWPSLSANKIRDRFTISDITVLSNYYLLTSWALQFLDTLLPP